MIEIFLIKPFIALILITISCVLLGIFVLWKKLAYFGDGLSHAILLGFVLGAIFNSSQITALIIFAIIFAMMVELISLNKSFSKDTAIAISSYFCIASAIILNDLLHKNLNFSSYIFGDIITVGNQEIEALAIITLIIIFYSFFAFRKILLINIDSDLAKIDGIKTTWWNLSLIILLALTIALSVSVVGVFLMTAILILPAAIAHIFSSSAKQMLLLSLLIGIAVAVFSFKLADSFNLTISAVMIAVFCIIFILSLTLAKASSNWALLKKHQKLH
ncbi:MAG: metal ABC transporter permease [Rickettsiales bacterium]|nr:metal ABC transporter permease [Rickettsiales bacterium]